MLKNTFFPKIYILILCIESYFDIEISLYNINKFFEEKNFLIFLLLFYVSVFEPKKKVGRFDRLHSTKMDIELSQLQES